MAIGIQGVSQWQNWRTPVTADDGTLISQFKPSEVWDGIGFNKFNATQDPRIISVHPFTAIAVGFWGTDANNETAVAEIIGYMFPDSKNGPGPGTQLWKGTATLANNIWSTSDKPHSTWTSAQYGTVDLLASTIDVASVTLAEAESEGALTAILLLPTLGFSHLLMQFTDVGTGAEMATVGSLWKGISKEGVL